MPKTIPPGRLAGAIAALSPHICDHDALLNAIVQVAEMHLGLTGARLVDSPADAAPEQVLLPLTANCSLVCEWSNNLDPELVGSFAAVAGGLLGQASRCELNIGEYAAVLSRLDEVRRDLDSAHRSEWIATERLRIAQDLHDRAAQTMFGLGLTTDWLLAQIDESNPMYGDLQRLKQMAATGLRQLRDAIFSLSSAPVDPPQFRTAVRSLLKDVDAAGMTGDLRVWGDVNLLTPEVTDALYQIIREALINVRRHSHASSVLVSVRIEAEQVTAVIQDDGEGIAHGVFETYRKNGAHMGLRGMEGRTERLGGKLTLAPGDECGLIVTATIPLKGAATHE